ncbi:MAG: hypothetical protein JNK30_08530 [Phenylobacterium sp.]|uniref:hypothetical protein n=1 Tax=Phenylobacterium sp. TaxID=1871053 RepID=UPI001A43731C|nr:hypothetical protein [Phenylobacterium sp.]MBL8771414.1 hypothetical protein [Phenylobacterium sp.]
MTQPPDDAPETPMQRALRLKTAALQAKPQPPGGRGAKRPASGIAAGASKPWMKR